MNASQPDWLDATQRSGQDLLQHMKQGREEVERAIAALGGENPESASEPRDESLPTARKGYAVAVADGGLLFDSAHSRATYLRNVRVNEERMNMRCRHRLYIQLPPSDVRKEGEGTLDVAAPSPAKASSSAGVKRPPKPLAAEGTSEAAPEAPVPTPFAPPSAQAQPPLQVWAYDAMVDGVENNILLCSHGEEGAPRLQRGENRLILNPCGQDACILADAQGNIHIYSGKAELQWVDEQGRRGGLVSERGHMVFHRDSHTLYIPGASHFVAPDGTTLDCEESLCVTLMPEGEAQTPEDEKKFLSQFTSLRYSGVEKAIVIGNVRAARPAMGATPAAVVQGEVCTYDGRTGACRIEGKTCRLTYGSQEIRTCGDSGMLSLAPNGDIRMEGADGLAGVYELPAREGTPPQRGTFETPGDMVFTTGTGQVHLPRGLHALDATNSFSCTGPLTLLLKPGEREAPERESTGMLNLAVASYADVAAVRAAGAVEMHYTDLRKNIPAEGRGETVFFDLEKGTARVTAAEGQECVLGYGGYRVTARCGEGIASAEVDEKGDIDVRGEEIHAVLPDREGLAELHTRDFLHLTRETRELEVGPGSRLHAPEGILTAQNILHLTLAPAAESAGGGKSPLARYPHLDYAFGGVESARTDSGGTIQTTKASMQCSGPIRVIFEPGQTGGAGIMSHLHATAEGHVAILGKDGSGRLVRATGDRLTITGNNKILTGTSVTLTDEKNTHIISGRGAQITVDERNNIRLRGEKHVTHATGLREQADRKKSEGKKD